MLAGSEMVDRLARQPLGVEPVVEVDVAGTLALIQVPFGIPEIHPHGLAPWLMADAHAGRAASASSLRAAVALSRISISRRCEPASAAERPVDITMASGRRCASTR